MARVKLSEFRAKSLLIEEYSGAELHLDSLAEDVAAMSNDLLYVIKVDQGIKQRGKQGLLKLDISKHEAEQAVRELADKGFRRFIAEPMFTHDRSEEQYLSLERTRRGMLLHHSGHGGVDVEENPGSVQEYSIDDAPLPAGYIAHLLEIMDAQHISFLEINPLIVCDDKCTALDAAVLVDSAGEHESDWTSDDIVEARTLTDAEKTIAQYNDNSAAAFSFRVLNANGALWLLLSGGGASITIADEAANEGKADIVGDYGEYSGGPTTEEAYLYTNEFLKQLLISSAPKKAIVIAGGVANFTDVKKTFGGVIQALQQNLDGLHQSNVKVYVRRGGPNEAEGLADMKKFLQENDLYGSVHGSDIVLTDVVHEALEYIDA
jgi:succinyl-CoA synthetase beta subunit